MTGGWHYPEVAASLWMDEEKIIQVFKSGEGIAWDDHRHRLFCDSEALFRPGYRANLIPQWIGSQDVGLALGAQAW